jgi:hypothetical protein
MMINRVMAGSVKLSGADGTSQEIALVADVPKEGEKAVYFCPMHTDVVQTTPGICPQCGGMKLYTQNRLLAKADLSKVEPGSLRAVVHVTGMKGPEKEATFTETNNPPSPEAETPKKG